VKLSDAMATHRVRQALAQALSVQRHRQGAESAQAFARAYLPHHFQLPGSPMHEELFSMMHHATEARGCRIAVAAPRGHAKSSIVSLAYVLWSILYGHEKLVMIASATKEQASQHLKHIKDEIETNARLIADFPDVLTDARGRRPTPWRGHKLQLPGGALLVAVGLNQQIRGIRHREHRPSLIIVDDLEMPEHVASEEHRAKNQEWFSRTLLKCGDDRTNVVVIGTVIHYDSLLARLLTPTNSPGWETRRYKALITEPDRVDLWATWESIYCGREQFEDVSGPQAAARFLEANRDAMHAGAEVLWQEKDPLPSLMEMRIREGDASFHSEKQNQPLDPEHCLFGGDAMRYWDDEHGTLDRLLAYLGSKARFYGAWDPSLGARSDRGDFSAIVILAHVEDTKTSYVIAADLIRRPPHVAINRIVEYARLYSIAQFAIEANGFQELLERDLKQAAERACARLPIQGVKSTSEKRGRIQALEPSVRQGAIRFCHKHTQFNEQLRAFPLAAHDDGPDALELALQAVRTPRVWII